jgi:two-component sensor histidine kinase
MRIRGIPMISLFIGFFALIIAAAFAVMLINVSSTIDREYRSEIAAKNGLVARSAAREVGTFLDSYFGALAVLAADPSAETIGIVKRAFSAISEVFIADPSGRVSFSTGADPSPGFDVSRQDCFRDAAEEGRPVLSDSSISRTNYHTTAYLSLRFREGVAVGVLDLHSLSEYVRSIVLNGDYLVALTDAKGTLVAHTEVERVDRSESIAWTETLKEEMTREGASGREMAFEGERFLVSAARVPGKRWIAIAAEPISTIRGTIYRVQYRVVAVLAAIMAAIAVACSGIIYAAGRALSGISAGIHSIASGDFAHAPPRTAIRELESLASDFRAMAEAVRVREERLTKSVEQKELMLKEIHHRVKNNLQLVESLLSLESRQARQDGRASLERAKERVDALASIHEMLYQSEDFGELRFDVYLRSLATGLAGPASLSMETDEIVLHMDQAIPCGLIANELITNAIRHAGTSGAPAIRMRLSSLPCGDEDRGKERRASARLEIEDNGPGFPPGFDPATSDSLGLRLLISLVDQIGGTWNLAPGPGARWTICIPVLARG